MANIAWQEWSEFGKSDITISSQTTTSLTQDRNYEGTNKVHIFAFSLSWKFWTAIENNKHSAGQG